MSILHSAIQSADCHEPKGITTKTTAEAGEVITPSSSVNGTSVMRRLNVGGDLDLRVVALTEAASIILDTATTDMGTVTLTAGRTLGAPAGTPRDGQEVTYRVTQDGTGGWVLGFDAIFTFQGGLPTPDLAAATTALYSFRWNAAVSKWQQYIKPLGISGSAYGGKTVKNNVTNIACPAMTDAVNFSTAADWRQLTGIFEAVEVAPILNVTRGTNDLTILITGVYHLEGQIVGENSINNTTVGLTFGINGVVQPDRNLTADFGGLGTRRMLTGHTYTTLTAGQVVSFWTAASAASNVLVRQGRFSATLINRTA